MLLLHEFTTFYTVTTGKNGGLGPCGYRPCFVCAVHSWLAVSTPWQGPTRGILQLPNQWRFHLRPHTSLLRLYGYLPHCYWSPHQFLTPLCLISRLPIFLYFVFVLYVFTMVEAFFDFYLPTRYITLAHYLTHSFVNWKFCRTCLLITCDPWWWEISSSEVFLNAFVHATQTCDDF